MMEDSDSILTFGKYFKMDIRKKIGEGSSGSVYLGAKIDTDEIIAVKCIKISSEQAQWDREQNAMIDLKEFNNPNILHFYGYQVVNLVLYLFLQYCPQTLKQKIQKGMSEEEVIETFSQILNAMKFMNQQGMLHRDLKPANIFINQNGIVKIGDFGLARYYSTQMTKNMGTTYYSAPQILYQQEYDFNCDVWSCGVILYEMLEKKNLFPLNKKEILKEVQKFKDESYEVKLNPNLNILWKTIIKLMLTYDRKKRKNFKEIHETFEIISKKLLELKISNKSSPYSLFTLTLKSENFSETKNETQISNFQNLEENLKSLKKLKQYTDLFNDKMKYIRKLPDVLNRHKNIKNMQNLNELIIFLGFGMMIEMRRQKIEQYQNFNILVTQNDSFIRTSFHNNQEMEVEKYRNAFIQVSQKQIINIRKYLLESILPKINLKLCNKYLWLKDLIKNFKQSKYQDRYVQHFKEVINDPPIYVKSQQLPQFDLVGLKFYRYLRIIANIDVCFKNQYYIGENYVNRKISEIENQQSPQKILKFVSAINIK